MTVQLRMTPQTVAVLRVLLETPTVPRYGLDLARETGLKTGTLHPILARIEQAGMLEKFWEETTDDVGRPRRRYYRFTGGGAETARLAIAAATLTSPSSGSRMRPQPGVSY